MIGDNHQIRQHKIFRWMLVILLATGFGVTIGFGKKVSLTEIPAVVQDTIVREIGQALIDKIDRDKDDDEAAQAIAEAIGDRPWLAEVEKRDYQAEMRIVEITGDLWKALGEEKLPKEQLQLTFVRERTADGTCPVAPWRESPIVLLGDSHNLVFHSGGDMHSLGAGLPDHLAHRIGFPVDLVAVRGSGATPSRLSLFRRRDNMKGKQLVIWCFSIREFTEGQGWRKIPVIR